MIEIVSKGLLTTVQDMGRRGHQPSGVPVCGAMDWQALAAANILAGNPMDEAALEITGLGPELVFHEANIFAVSGGDFDMSLDGAPIAVGRAYVAPRGARLKIGAARAGFRACLAFCGGLDIPVVLGSRSTCLTAGFGGHEGRPLAAGDRIGFRAPQTWLPALERRAWAYPLAQKARVRAVPGPQDAAFSPEGMATFFSGVYTITAESNRMGYRTAGPEIAYKPGCGPNIISDGIAPGAVQVPNGRPIILMADRQTVGGYTKIATVITADLPVVAQLKPGDSLTFEPAEVAPAQAAYRAAVRRLRSLAFELDAAGPEW